MKERGGTPFLDSSWLVSEESRTELLNPVERALTAFLDHQTKQKGNVMIRPRVEREPWRQPGVVLTWEGLDQIGRSIDASYVVDESPQPHCDRHSALVLVIEINAWHDELEQRGVEQVEVRYWQHAEVGRLPPRPTYSALLTELRDAYQLVSQWQREHLAMKDLLPAVIPVS